MVDLSPYMRLAIEEAKISLREGNGGCKILNLDTRFVCRHLTEKPTTELLRQIHPELRFTPKPVYQTEEMKVVLAYFKPGQFIPVHSPQVDVVLCVLEGEAEIVAGDELVTAKKDDLIIVPKGHKRGVKALSELTLLHVVQPPPGEADHKEVHQRLSDFKGGIKGKFYQPYKCSRGHRLVPPVPVWT